MVNTWYILFCVRYLCTISRSDRINSIKILAAQSCTKSTKPTSIPTNRIARALSWSSIEFVASACGRIGGGECGDVGWFLSPAQFNYNEARSRIVHFSYYTLFIYISMQHIPHHVTLCTKHPHLQKPNHLFRGRHTHSLPSTHHHRRQQKDTKTRPRRRLFCRIINTTLCSKILPRCCPFSVVSPVARKMHPSERGSARERGWLTRGRAARTVRDGFSLRE